MKRVGSIALCFVLLVLLYFSPLHAETAISAEFVGHWRGVYGDSKIDQRAAIGAGFAQKDIGHKIESFEFNIDSGGRISGRGVASYWFNVSGTIPLAAANAHLDGGIKKVEFLIEGNIKNGGAFVTSKAVEKLTLINTGKHQLLEAWNVFGPWPAKLDKETDGLSLGSSATNEQLGMKLKWKAIKEGLQIYEIWTPGPNRSFIFNCGISNFTENK